MLQVALGCVRGGERKRSAFFGVIADDFTGASDIAKGMAPHGGLRTAQFLGVLKTAAYADLEAGVVAPEKPNDEEAVAQSLDALNWLLAQGCQQIVFKYCSTFDSTRDGNIGPVGEALAAALEVKSVVACPAFPGAGRTVYMAHLFVHDRLLSESGMQNHSLTSMTDPDIHRWLRYQTRSSVGHVALDTVRKGAEEVAAALPRRMIRWCHFAFNRGLPHFAWFTCRRLRHRGRRIRCHRARVPPR